MRGCLAGVYPTTRATALVWTPVRGLSGGVIGVRGFTDGRPDAVARGGGVGAAPGSFARHDARRHHFVCQYGVCRDGGSPTGRVSGAGVPRDLSYGAPTPPAIPLRRNQRPHQRASMTTTLPVLGSPRGLRVGPEG